VAPEFVRAKSSEEIGSQWAHTPPKACSNQAIALIVLQKTNWIVESTGLTVSKRVQEWF